MAEPRLSACPFCGHVFGADLSDVLYPNGTAWRDMPYGRRYLALREARPGDGKCWGVVCSVSEGGCGAEVSADSREAAVAKWNRRSAALPAGESAEEVQGAGCNPHPGAPHGFDRNASHSLGRYVCECESWSPPGN